MKNPFIIFIFLLFCTPVYSAEEALKDEIIFFNVGQGHAALANKIGHVPLLVDAGSDSRPYTAGEMYDWTKIEETHLLTQISDKVLKYWKNYSIKKFTDYTNYQL